MKDRILNEEASERIVGRGFIIAVVVLFSSLSFTLGYFVGKNHPQPKSDSLAQVVSEPPAGQPQQNVTVSNPQFATPDVRSTGEESRLQEKKDPGQAVSSTPQSRPVSDKSNIEQKEAVGTVPKEKPNKESEEVVGTDTKSASKPAEDNVTYTVQIGALKSAAEARHLKEKYAKKGYKTSITVSHGKHKEKIYKVRAGEFKEKKEADILALRLKKSEGLSAFVTTKVK